MDNVSNGADNDSKKPSAAGRRALISTVAVALMAASQLGNEFRTLGFFSSSHGTAGRSTPVVLESSVERSSLSHNNHTTESSTNNIPEQEREPPAAPLSPPLQDTLNPPPEVINPNVVVQGKSYSLHDDALSSHLPLPKPVLIVGLPKSGTTSAHFFFKDAGYRSIHYICGSVDQFCGHCIRDAIAKGLPPLKSCGNYDVWAQMDVTYFSEKGIKDCHFPQFTDLEALHQEAPNATLILNRRELDPWAKSVEGWYHMNERLTHCQGGPKASNKAALKQWHLDHVQNIRQFVQTHPSHALVEIDIQEPSTGKQMATLFQIDEKYWGQKNTNTKGKSRPLTVTSKAQTIQVAKAKAKARNKR